MKLDLNNYTTDQFIINHDSTAFISFFNCHGPKKLNVKVAKKIMKLLN